MNNTKTNNNNKVLLSIALVIAVGAVAYAALTMPDRRSPTEKLGDAIHELPKGPDKALRQLEERTPGERVGDAVKDVGEDIKRNTDQ